MRILGIDPGTTKTAMCMIDSETLRPLFFSLLPNEEMRTLFKEMPFKENDVAAIEMLQSYGMPVGREVMETAVWIGRFQEILTERMKIKPVWVYRTEEKMHICHSVKAGDSNIRRALIDRFAVTSTGKGTKKNPDFFYGFKADIWAAYAVALTAAETKFKE